LGGWLAGGEVASARADSQQGVAIRAGYKASTTHRTKAGHRRRPAHRAHV